VSAGIFELYTKLGPGDVKMVDATTGTPTEYYINGTKLLQGANATSPATTAAAYFTLVPVPDNQWNNSYKFIATADRKNVDLLVMMQPTAYTHQVKVR